MKPHNSKQQNKATAHRSGQQSETVALTWRAGGLALTVLCAVVLMLGATEPEEATRDSRKKIEEMTPAERAQLKRNFEKFQKLTPEEKARYRKIHEAIHNKPELSRVMRCYEEWVRTLSPWEQEDLRKAKSPEERMALIRKIRSEQQEKHRWKRYRNYFDVMKILKLDNRDPGMWFMIRTQPPSAGLYQQVVGMIEKSLPEPVNYPGPKAELTEFQKSLAVLRAAAEVKQQDSKKGSDWPQPEVVNSAFDLIEKDEYHFFRESGSGELRGGTDRLRNLRDDQKRTLLTLFLAKGLVNQLILSVRDELEQTPVPEAQLQKFFEGLDNKEKESLLKHPPEELQERLKFMYLRDHLPKEVRRELTERAREAQQVAIGLARGGDMRALEGQFRQRSGGLRNRFPNSNNRRPNGPGGRGDRNFRERDPARKPGKERVRPRPAQPDA